MKFQLVAYFTWIPVMLLCQAIVFCIPQYIWNRFNKTNGIAFNELVGNCHENRHCKKQLKTAAKMLRTAVCKDDSYRNMGLLKRLVTGTSLTISYFLCNILTLAMTAAQFFVLAYVLRAPGVMWGFDTLKGLLFPENRISTQFPDSFNCDVWAIRTDKDGKENKYHEMLTCSLPMNSTIEKTVASFWVLLCIAGVAATISIFYWVTVHLFAISRKSFVNSFLRASKVFIGSIDNHVSPSDFCDNFLTPDAILIIRFFEFNGYVILARDLVAQLFMIYAEEQIQQILSLEEGTSGLEEDSASEPVMDSNPNGENIEVQGYESAHEEVIDEISASEASRDLLSYLFCP